MLSLQQTIYLRGIVLTPNITVSMEHSSWRGCQHYTCHSTSRQSHRKAAVWCCGASGVNIMISFGYVVGVGMQDEEYINIIKLFFGFVIPNMHSEENNVNTAPVKQSTGKTSTGLGTKARGVAEVIHGGVESLRGSTLGTSNTVVGRTASASKNDELAKKGRLEMDRGLAKLKGNVEHQAEQSGLPPGRGAQELPATVQGHNDFPHGPQNTGQYPPTRYGTEQIPPAPHQPTVQQPTATIQGPSAGPGHAAKQIPPGQAGGQLPPGGPAHADRSAHPPADLSVGKESELHASSGETDPQTLYHHRDDGVSRIPQHQLNDIQAHANHPNDQVLPAETLNRSVQAPAGKAVPHVSSSAPRPDPGHHHDEGGIPQDQPNNTKSPNEQPKVVLPHQDIVEKSDPRLVAEHGTPAPIN